MAHDAVIQGFVLEVDESHPVATDVEYDYKERITVSGCRYEYCSKGQDAWIMWDDSKYSYMIIATNIKEAKEVLIKMVEDIYL